MVVPLLGAAHATCSPRGCKASTPNSNPSVNASPSPSPKLNPNPKQGETAAQRCSLRSRLRALQANAPADLA